MFKRLIWFGSGALSGAAGGWYIKRRIQEKIDQKLRRFTPGGLRQEALARAKQAQLDAKIALDETRKLANRYRSDRPPPG